MSWHLDLALLPALQGIPFGTILRELTGVGFDPDASFALLEAHNARLPGRPLRPQGCRDGGPLVTEAVLHPPHGPWAFVHELGRDRVSFDLQLDQLPWAAEFFRAVGRGDSLESFAELCPLGAIPRCKQLERWVPVSGHGLTRREHASLVIHTERAKIVLDPIGLQKRLPNMARCPLLSPDEALDAIVISHGHVDHWHLPSLLATARSSEVAVIVPEVSRDNLLTSHHFDEALAACGQRHRVARWGDRLSFADIELEALPFYGEQPARDERTVEPTVRNCGNAYWVRTPRFSAAILVDTGADPTGSMPDVLADLRRREGAVDVVLACTREFQSPFFGGLDTDWAALPFVALRSLFVKLNQGTLPTATAGPAGIAEACAAAGARTFLSSANGFQGVGVEIDDIGWGLGEPSEADQLAVVQRLLTRCVAESWRVGDTWRPA